MSLPKDGNAQELLKLKERVAELEAELKNLKDTDPLPEGEANLQDELQHSQLQDVQTEEEITTATVEQANVVQYGSELLVEQTQIAEEINLLSNVEVPNVVMQNQLVLPTVSEGEEQATLIDGEYALPEVDITTPNRRNGKHECPQCKKKFPFLSELNRHISTHSSMEEREASKKLVCNICDKRFHWKCDLSRHVLTHGTARPHVCDVCNAAFKLAEGLKKHMLIHTEAAVKCYLCNKSYRSEASLRNHSCPSVSDPKDRNNICQICNKGFTRRDVLMVHVRSHTGERPYVCDICKKGFNTASKRSAHMPTHRNRPYICHGCNKSFTRVDALQNHFHLDDKVWNENLKLRDVQVTTCSNDRVMINLETCIELSDSEMDTEEMIAQEDCEQSMVSESSAPSEFLTSTPAHSTAPPTSIAEAIVTEQPAETSTIITTQSAIPEASAIETSQEAGPSTSQEPQSLSVNLSNYQQLLGGDKDGHALIQLHVLPSEDGKFHVVASTKDSADPNTSNSPAVIIGTLSGNTENGSPSVTIDIPTSASTPRPKSVPSTPFPIHDLHLLPKVLNTISVIVFPGYPVPPCILCGETFENVDVFTEHLLIHMSSKLHRCERCFAGFDSLEDLDTHHCKPPVYNCHKCSQTCNEYCSLLSHITSVHKKDYVSTAKQTRTRTNFPGISKSKALESLTCWYCEDTFQSKPELDEHSKVQHTGSYPFKCKYCDKAYAKKPYLRAHIRSHTGEKHPHQCQLCEKNFSTSQRLKIHVRSHTGERPYKCDVCTKGFHRKYVLNLHKRSHTGEKPYNCSFCEKKYKCFTDCRRHTEEVHEGRRYPCKDCGKLFKRSTYRSHMIKKHGAYKTPDTSEIQFPDTVEAMESTEIGTMELEDEEVDVNVLVDGVMESPLEDEVVSVGAPTTHV